MATKEELQEAQERLLEHFGSRESHLGWQILMLSQSQQPVDITFWKKPPLLDIKIDPQISLAMMYGAGPKKLQEMLDSIKLSDGSRVSFGEIWTINPMPFGGFTQEELDAVDLSIAEEPGEPGGTSRRKMIGDTYHCKTREEEDKFLRRFIAS